MPTSLLSTDTMFPNFKGNETTEEKVDQIQNYLYMLVEQLRYSMANVGKENFNETEFDSIVNLITEPVYLQLKNETGEINSSIQATAENLTLRIEGVNENLGETNQIVTTLQASVNGFNTKVEDLSGKYTSLQQTVNGFNATVGEINGQYSSVTQNVASITARVDGHDGRFSTIEESVGNIKLEVNGASVKLTGGGGGEGTVTITGAVTFEEARALADTAYTNATQQAALDLSSFKNGLATSNYTTINGGNIKTGIVDGVTFYARGEGQSFIVMNGKDEIGGIRYDYRPEDGVYGDKMYLYTKSRYDGINLWRPSVKLESEGNISIEAPEGLVYIKGLEYITIVQGATQWTFQDGALYKNGTPVL